MSHFLLRLSPSDKVKVVISVSKKVARKAVTRNLIKRRVRAVVREFKKNLKPNQYLLIARPKVEEIKGQELRNELKTLFKL